MGRKVYTLRHVDVSDPAATESPQPNAPGRVVFGIFVWIALACLSAGLIAESQRWPSL